MLTCRLMLDPLYFLQMSSRSFSLFHARVAPAPAAEMVEMGVAAVPAAPASRGPARSERSATSRAGNTAPTDSDEIEVVVSTTRCVGTSRTATVTQKKSLKGPVKSVRSTKRVVPKNTGVKRKAGVTNIKACHARAKEYDCLRAEGVRLKCFACLKFIDSHKTHCAAHMKSEHHLQIPPLFKEELGTLLTEVKEQTVTVIFDGKYSF
jgi:hypothetical protein